MLLAPIAEPLLVNSVHEDFLRAHRAGGYPRVTSWTPSAHPAPADVKR